MLRILSSGRRRCTVAGGGHEREEKAVVFDAWCQTGFRVQSATLIPEFSTLKSNHKSEPSLPLHYSRA